MEEEEEIFRYIQNYAQILCKKINDVNTEFFYEHPEINQEYFGSIIEICLMDCLTSFIFNAGKDKAYFERFCADAIASVKEIED